MSKVAVEQCVQGYWYRPILEKKLEVPEKECGWGNEAQMADSWGWVLCEGQKPSFPPARDMG